MESFPFRNLHFYVNEINQGNSINTMCVSSNVDRMVHGGQREANLRYRLSGKKGTFLVLCIDTRTKLTLSCSFFSMMYRH